MRRLLCLAVLATACGLAPSLSLAGDKEIAQQVIQELRTRQKAGGLKGFSIGLKVENGTVWVKGRVANPAQQALVLDVARRVQGVKLVVNELALQPAQAQPSVARKAAAKPSLLSNVSKSVSGLLGGKKTAEAKTAAKTPAAPTPNRSIALPKPQQSVALASPSNTKRLPATRSSLQDRLAAATRATLRQAGGLQAQDVTPQKITRAPLPVRPAISRLSAPPVERQPVAQRPAPALARSAAARQPSVRIRQASAPAQPAAVQPKPVAEQAKPAAQPQAAKPLVSQPVLAQQAAAPAPQKATTVVAAPAVPAAVGSGVAGGQQPRSIVRPVQAAQPYRGHPAHVAMRRGPAGYHYHPGHGYPRPVAYHSGYQGMPVAIGQSAPPSNTYVPGRGTGIAPVRYDHPHMPAYAWPSYAAHPNYAGVTYPRQYSPTAWPYIGPFYPYPQVPLGWRKVELQWKDGWWFLDFKSK